MDERQKQIITDFTDAISALDADMESVTDMLIILLYPRNPFSMP